MALDTGKIRDFVQKTWDQSIVPTLHEYVKIPAKSPMFDAQWREHGHIDRAVELLRGWASERPIEGLHIEVVRLEGRTPVIFMEAPGTGADTVLLYGHLDKQPEMVGWAEGTGPWTPVGLADGRDPPARLPRRDPTRADRRGARGGEGARHRDLRSLSVPAGRSADQHRCLRADPEQHVAARARDHRRRRASVARRRGQRAPPEDIAQALAPAAADVRGRPRGAPAQGDSRGRSALRRARHPRHLWRRRQRLERAGDGSEAARVDPARVGQLFRQARDVRGPRRLDSVHEHARRALPAGPV